MPVAVAAVIFAGGVLLALFSQLRGEQDLQVALNELAYFIAGFSILVASITALFLWHQRRMAYLKKKALKMVDIDRMDGIKFEHYVADLLKNQGYQNVKVTSQTNDFGVDITFTDDNQTYAAQVKRKRGLVGVQALYQATGGRDYYRKDQAAVITNSHFSEQAVKLAKKTGMLLIDRDTLSKWMVQFQASN